MYFLKLNRQPSVTEGSNIFRAGFIVASINCASDILIIFTFICCVLTNTKIQINYTKCIILKKR